MADFIEDRYATARDCEANPEFLATIAPGTASYAEALYRAHGAWYALSGGAGVCGHPSVSGNRHLVDLAIAARDASYALFKKMLNEHLQAGGEYDHFTAHEELSSKRWCS